MYRRRRSRRTPKFDRAYYGWALTDLKVGGLFRRCRSLRRSVELFAIGRADATDALFKSWGGGGGGDNLPTSTFSGACRRIQAKSRC